MGNPPLIREMSDQDTKAVTEIQAQAVLEGVANFDLIPLNELQMAEKIAAMRNNQHPHYVAEVDGVVAGFAYATPYRTRPAYRWAVENSIYVSPLYQERGIGSALLSTIIDRATELGFRQMVAIIGDTGNTASIALHRKHGFEMTGTLYNVGFKHGRWLDTVIMQLTLGDGAEKLPSEDTYPGTLFQGGNK